MLTAKMVVFMIFSVGTVIPGGNIEYQKILTKIGCIGSVGSLIGWSPLGIKSFFQEYQNINQSLFGRMLLDALHANSM